MTRGPPRMRVAGSVGSTNMDSSMLGVEVMDRRLLPVDGESSVLKSTIQHKSRKINTLIKRQGT